MKLFQQMLVAATGLSLIAPIGVQASDFNIEGMNTYVRKKSSSKTKKQFNSNTFANELATFENVDNSSDKFDEFEAGTFSDTTTMDGKAVMYVGTASTDDSSITGQTKAEYTYQMNVNSSFTGDDNLYIRLKSGNATGWSDTKSDANTYLSAASGKSDLFTVDKMWYSFPLAENHTVYVGPKIENYYMHATSPSIYKPVLKSFTLGGNAAAYGASTSPGAGWAYNADNGFALSSNFTSQAGNTNRGILTGESKTSWATQVGITKPQYSASVIVNMKYNEWEDGYFRSSQGMDRSFGRDKKGSTNVGLRTWWRPLETGTVIPQVSLGYDTSSTQQDGSSSTNAYFAGLTWQDMIHADDRIGVAIGQPQMHEDDGVEPFLYEAYYSYQINDSMSVTPAIFGGQSKNSDGISVDMTGYVVNTTYKF